MNNKITRKQIEKATELANGYATHYKSDVLSLDGIRCLMPIVWGDMEGRTIGDFFAVFANFLGPKHIPQYFGDVVEFAELQKAAFKAEKCSTGIADLATWYIIK